MISAQSARARAPVYEMFVTGAPPLSFDLGEVCWVPNPPFTDLLNLLVLIATPSVFDTQRLRASLVWLLRNRAHRYRATGVFGELKLVP